jgi:hypothetical protein
MKKIAYNAGVWKKRNLNKDTLSVEDALYVAPTSKGAYLGQKRPDMSGEEIMSLLEIHYSDPNFFRDYRRDTTELGQEGLWVGKNLKLKKVKDTMVKMPKRIAGDKPLRYRHIVAEVDEKSSERTPTNEEYMAIVKKFMKKYDKSCVPDDFNEKEKKFFYDSLQGIVRRNDVPGDSETKEKPKDLEKVLRAASVMALIGSISFFSSNLTGNVIGSSSLNSNSIMGVFLLAMGILFYLFSTKRKKHNLPLPKR